MPAEELPGKPRLRRGDRFGRRVEPMVQEQHDLVATFRELKARRTQCLTVVDINGVAAGNAFWTRAAPHSRPFSIKDAARLFTE